MRPPIFGFCFSNFMRGRALCTTLSLVALLVSTTTCRPSAMTLPLAFTPTSAPSGAMGISGPRNKIFVMPLVDQRDDKARIGENREKPDVVPIYAGVPAPAEFVHDALVDQLRAGGVNIVQNSQPADRLIAVTLTKFWVNEESNYVAQIVADIEVRDKTGTLLWSGTARGGDTTFGRSLSVENYQQVLSDSMVALASSILRDSGFQKAISAVDSSGADQQRP